MKSDYLFFLSLVSLLIVFIVYAVSDHFYCVSRRLWVVDVCENEISAFVNTVIVTAPRSSSRRAFFLRSACRSLHWWERCKKRCCSGILAHFWIRHKPLMHNSRAVFSMKMFDISWDDDAWLNGSFCWARGFFLGRLWRLPFMPDERKPTTEGAPTNRPPCLLKWTCLPLCDSCACCNTFSSA